MLVILSLKSLLKGVRVGYKFNLSISKFGKAPYNIAYVLDEVVINLGVVLRSSTYLKIFKSVLYALVELKPSKDLIQQETTRWTCPECPMIRKARPGLSS